MKLCAIIFILLILLNGCIADGSFPDEKVADRRALSDPAHDQGMMLIDDVVAEGKTLTGEILAEAIHSCGSELKYACAHGAVMEYFEFKHAEPGAMMDVCNKLLRAGKLDETQHLNCLHGTGHMITAQNKMSLTELVRSCPQKSNKETHACVSGVLIEYGKTGATGLGHHSHGKVGSFELPCKELPQEFMPTCYSSAGSYRQYYPNQEPIEDSMAYCASIPDEFEAWCMAGINERLRIANGSML